MKRVLYIIGLFVCLWIGYYVGKKQNNHLQQETITETIIRTDTITKTDTLIKEIISPKYIREEIVRVDTIKADTTLLFQRRTYLTQLNEDSISGEIKAVVSGYNAVLDSLNYCFNIPIKEIYTEKEIITERVKKQRCNIGFFVGPSYNVINRSVDLSVGVGFTFNPF